MVHEWRTRVRLSAHVAVAVLVVACSRTAPPTSERAVAVAVPADAAIDTSAATVSSPSPSPSLADPPGTYMGRVIASPMSYRGADWLDRGEREETQKPEYVLDVVGIHAGQTVADVGCGSGYFTTRLAKRVGPTGRVLATDLQPEMLELLKKKVAAQQITNVVPLLATPEDAKLPRGELDVVLMVDVYHELPKPPVTLAQIKTALAPKGRLALVEYKAEDPKVAIKPEHKTTLVQLRRELEANGFAFVSTDESLPEQRIVVFEPSR